MKKQLYNKTVFWLVVSCSLPLFSMQAQQLPQYTQYMFSVLPYNPAFAGTREALNIDAAARIQWQGIKGLPVSQQLGAHLPIPLLKSGFGTQLSNTFIGAERNSVIQLAYNYQLLLKKFSMISIGISGGVLQKGIDGSKLISSEGEYENTINHNDPILPTQIKNSLAPYLSAGLFYKNNKLQLGLAAQQIVPTKIKISEDEKSIQSAHVYAHAQYIFSISNNTTLEPSLLLQSDIKTFQTDISLVSTIYNHYKAGVALRGVSPQTFDAVSIIGGIYLKNNLLLVYSFDYTLSLLNKVSKGTHELSLHYTLKNILTTKSAKTMYNPRFL